jgi:hypothetical protein
VMIGRGLVWINMYVQANIYILETSGRSEASVAKPNKGASLMNFKICWTDALSQTPQELSSREAQNGAKFKMV